MRSFRLAGVAAALALCLGAAHADSLQQPIVVGTSAAGVQVTSLDLVADASAFRLRFAPNCNRAPKTWSNRSATC